MSRFDRRDPGQDPEYCDGLEAAEPEPVHFCPWCNEPLPCSWSESYCSLVCMIAAECENQEDQ